MQVIEKDPNRRTNERLDLSLQLSLPDQKSKTMNISATGVYFEIITNAIKTYSPGTIIPFLITTATAGYGEIKLKLAGRGLVTRNDIREITNRGNKLGVAL
ncbi:MAG: hypothetical protein ACE5GV_15735 [Candidatus Scalindua sp.]